MECCPRRGNLNANSCLSQNSSPVPGEPREESVVYSTDRYQSQTDMLRNLFNRSPWLMLESEVLWIVAEQLLAIVTIHEFDLQSFARVGCSCDVVSLL